MAKDIKMSTMKDFRGGLNLRADAFELAPNESPDLLNVDIDPRGGVEQRNGITMNASSLSNGNIISDDDSTAYTAVAGQVSAGLTKARITPGSPAFAGSTPAQIRLTCTAPGQQSYFSNFTGTGAVAGRFPVSASTLYSAFAKAKWVTGVAKQVAVWIDWYNSGGAFISRSTGTYVATDTFGYSIAQLQATSPGTAATAYVGIFIGNGVTNPVATDVVDVSQLYVARGYNTSVWHSAAASSGLAAEVTGFALYERPASGISQVFVSCNGAIYYRSTGGTQWTALGEIGLSFVHQPFLQFKDVLIIPGHTQNNAWNGSTLTVKGNNMVPVFNDNLAAPADNQMPIHKFIAAFQGLVWIASPMESSYKTNRIRWSHPNQPFDWRSFDYIDIDTGADGDEITGLVPLEDRLLVFKRKSIYAVTGTSPDNFQVFPVSRTIGAVSQNAIVRTDLGVFFYDINLGVFLYDGKSVKWQFERLYPLITEGNVGTNYGATAYQVGWSGRRLWVSLPWKANRADVGTVPRVFVMDPTLSKEGSWTAYSVNVGTMFLLDAQNFSTKLLGAAVRSSAGTLQANDWGRTYTLEDATQVDQPYDVEFAGNVHITSYFVTPWFDAGQPVLKKRWRRPEFIARSLNSESIIRVDTRLDWDSKVTRRTFNLTTAIDQATMIWGDPWGEEWAGGDANSPRSEHHKGPSLGQSRSLQLKINGPDVNKHWGLNAMTIKYTIKPPRS